MSQFVWTCACGWRSTSENSALGIRGHAPAQCRRCGSLRLTVTSEKHPKVTHICKNPDCRQDFIGHVGAKHCAKCRPVVRGKKLWDGRRKYVWTPERDQILLDHYNHNATAIAKRFFPGWEKWVISHRAQLLGLCRTKEQPWTKAEDAFLREWAGVHTPNWMAKQLRRRTITAIIVRLKRLQISRRIQPNGLTMWQLEQALGVDHRQIVAWWRSGRLKGRYLTNPHEHDRYEFQEADVAAFLLQNPSSFRLDRVDQAWFMGMMREAVEHRTGSSTGERVQSEPAGRARRARNTAREAGHRGAAVGGRGKPPVIPERVACVGVDARTPCATRKQVVPRRGLPARCPDCTLAFRQQLRREELARLRRIRSLPMVPPHDELEATT
jgi:hypothetical protein